MGYSNWSDAAFRARQNQRTETGQSAFTYDQQVRASGVVEVHPQMNPFGATRESRDSDDHPESLSIAVLFDVTGSMGTVPRVLQTKLGALMRLLIQRGYVAHPQVLFGAIGDAFTDRVPLQIGQFESGLEMDDDLGKFFLEGGGGGQTHESYELGIYFIAHHTTIDCYEKRGKKGYLFTIGDEKPYDSVRAEHVRRHIGDQNWRNVALSAVLKKLLTRYEYFHIVPTNTYHGQSADVQTCWKALIGERMLLLEDEAAVCETIALAIALCEGTIDDLYESTEALVGVGHDRSAATAASKAVAPYAARRAPIARVASGTLPISAAANQDDGRL